MKTNQTIELISSEAVEEYDPLTGLYSTPSNSSKKVRSLVTRLTQKQAFEMYGTRENKFIVARFEQPQSKFSKAIFNDEVYFPVEEVGNIRKDSVILKKGEI